MATVRPATAGEVPAVSAALAEAFADEALMNWMLPQRTRRLARRELMFTLELHTYVLPQDGLPAIERCDSDGLPAYLEASSERSAALYQRLGFVHVGVLELPDGPRLWPMRRPPVS